MVKFALNTVPKFPRHQSEDKRALILKWEQQRKNTNAVNSFTNKTEVLKGL